MAANQPEENKPLKSEGSDDEDDNNNKPEAKPVVVEPKQPQQPQQPQQATPAAMQQQEAMEPGQERTKDAQDYVAEVGVACNKCYNWFPIGLFGWIGGILLVVCCVIDLIITELTFTQFFVVALLICGGLIMILVEMPSAMVKKQNILQKLQLILYEWLKLLSRMWGRAIYCLILVIMCFSEMGGGFRSIPWIAGMYFAALIILYFIFGLLAAKKYNGLYVYISNIEIVEQKNIDIDISIDHDQDVGDDDNKEQVVMAITDDGDLLKQKFAQKFDEMDEDKDGRVGRKDIAKLGIEANLELSNSECHAIVCYLDDDCNGEIVKDDWCRMWLKNTRLIWM